MAWSAVAVFAALVLPLSARSETLPLCNDVKYSPEQVQAAIAHAKDVLRAQGKDGEDLNSPDLRALMAEVAKELRCRLPTSEQPPQPPR